MEEFLKLYLTGERAYRYTFSKRLSLWVGILEILFAAVPYILVQIRPEDALPLALMLPFAILALLAGICVYVLGRRRVKLAYALVEEQHEANLREYTGEEKSLYEKLYAAFTVAYGRKETGLSMLLDFFSVLFLTVIAIFSVITGIATYSKAAVYTAIVIVFGGIAGAIVTVTRALRDGRGNAKMYELAQYEIDTVKRKNGIDETKIWRSAELARVQRGGVPAVELFLKDEIEKKEFRKISKRQQFGALFFVLAFFVVGIFVGNFEESLNNLTLAILAGVFVVTMFTVGVILLIRRELEKKNIYYRNAMKLGVGEIDSLRLDLQNKWLKEQKAANIFCIVSIVLGIITGIVLGFIGVFLNLDPQVGYGEQFIGCVSACTFLGLLLGLVGTIVIFAVYRHRVKGAEFALSKALQEEQRRAHEGKQ